MKWTRLLKQAWNDLSPRKKMRMRLRFVAILVVFGGTFFTAISIQTMKFFNAYLCASAVFLGTVLEFVVGDLLTDFRYPLKTASTLQGLQLKLKDVSHGIEKVLQKLIFGLSGCSRELVNATVHVKVDFFTLDESVEMGYVQIVDYVGSYDRPSWRISSATKGVVGRCLRTRKTEHVNFSTDLEFKERMVSDFGFTEGETEGKGTAKSYLAYPIWHENKVIGAIFMFSAESQIFPRSVDEDKIKAISEEIAQILLKAGVL